MISCTGRSISMAITANLRCNQAVEIAVETAAREIPDRP